MVDFKKDTWIYVIIAAVLALISILTPIATDAADSLTWFSGILQYNEDAPTEWIGGGAASIWTLGITCMSIATLFFYGIHNMKGMEFKWDWLFYALIGIALIIFPILMMVYDLDGAFGKMDIGFAPIGILISGILCIGAFALEKFVGGE